jgi:amphi-Trp domain-containing protein
MTHQRDDHEHDEHDERDDETTPSESEEGDEADEDEADEADEDDAKSEKDGKKSKEKLSFDATMAREEAVAYFESIVAGLRSGSITFRRDERALTLEVGASLDIEVKATKKGEKQKVRFEIAWRGGDKAGLTIVPS